jgi:transcriptional regulator with XRE-family HTH domain
MSTGQRIKKLRKEKKINQTELGEILNTTYGNISAIETERSTITTELLIKLSEYFGVSTDYILTGKEGNKELNEEEKKVIEIYRKDTGLKEILNEFIAAKKKIISYLEQRKQTQYEAV